MKTTRFQKIIAVALSLLLLISAAPLTAAQKTLVENYETLTAAEARYAELKAAADRAAADAVYSFFHKDEEKEFKQGDAE